jgi:hypothetical protein
LRAQQINFDLLLSDIGVEKGARDNALIYFSNNGSFGAAIESSVSDIILFSKALASYTATRKQAKVRQSKLGDRLAQLKADAKHASALFKIAFQDASGSMLAAGPVLSKVQTKMVEAITNCASAIVALGTSINEKYSDSEKAGSKKRSVLRRLQDAVGRSSAEDKKCGYKISGHDIMCEVHNVKSSWEECIDAVENEVNSGPQLPGGSLTPLQMLACAEYFQTEVFADARELLDFSEKGLGERLSDVDVRNAASQIAQHLPVLVVSTKEKPPKCKLVNVHELQLHPEALYLLLSIDTKETEEEERQAAQTASVGVVVRFTRDHSKYACVQFEKTNAGLMCIDGKQQALESTSTQCFDCELCACWRCTPRSFSTIPYITPDATNSSVQCMECALCDCPRCSGSSGLLWPMCPAPTRCSVESSPVFHGGLISTYCSHKRCRNNKGRVCNHSGSDIEQAFYSQDGLVEVDGGRIRYKPDWGHKYDEDGVEMVFEDGMEVDKPHGGGYLAAHQLFPQIASVTLTFLQQHSGHSAEERRR